MKKTVAFYLGLAAVVPVPALAAGSPGCNQRAVLAFNLAILRGAGGESIEEAFADRASNCVTINGADRSACDAVPSRPCNGP